MVIRAFVSLLMSTALSALMLCASPVFGEVQHPITRHVVNGFDVFLVDTGYGNTTKFVAYVSTGMLHDDPKTTAGRAHLLEHIIFTGSERFPGISTFNELMTQVGGSNNAETDISRTFYYWSGHQKRLQQVMVYFGAMMSHPEWNEAAFQSEKDVVINESTEYLGEDSTVLSEFAEWVFLPEGHPFKTYMTGSEEILKRMTLTDLKELFYANYVPGSMFFLVTGNFSESVGMNKDQVLADLRENFKVPTPYEFFSRETFQKSKDIRIQNPFATKPSGKSQLKMLRVEGGARTMIVKFYNETDTEKINHAAVETLRDLFSLEIEGSFSRRLNEAELATEVDFDTDIVNNSLVTILEFQLHDNNEGPEAEMKVLMELAGFLKELKISSLSSELLEYLFERNVVEYESLRVNARVLANIIVEKIQTGEDPLETLNFRERFRVSAEDLKTAATALFPSFGQALIASMTPELEESEDFIHDDLFDRDYQTVQDSDSAMLNRLEAAHPSSVLETIQIAKLPFDLVAPVYSKSATSAGESQKAESVEFSYPDTSVRLQYVPKLSIVTVGMLFRFPRDILNVDRSLLIRIFIDALNDHIRPVLDFAWAKGHSVSLSDDLNGLTISLTGSSDGIINLQAWLLGELQNFQPTKQQIESVLTNLKSEKAEICDVMTAETAERTLSASLCNRGFPSVDEKLNALRDASSTEIRLAFDTLMKNTNLSVFGAGDINAQQLVQVARNARQVFKGTVAREKTLGLEWFAGEQSLTNWHKLSGNKNDDQIGIARAFKGPRVDHPDYAAFLILSNILDDMIFNENREVRALGYIQNAKLIFRDSQAFILFAGQTDKNEERHLEISQGWATVLQKIHIRGVSANQVIAQVRSYVDRSELVATHSSEFIARLVVEEQRGGNPGWTDEFVKEVAKVTVEDVNDVFRKYFSHNPQFVQVIAATKRETAEKVALSCGGIFQ